MGSEPFELVATLEGHSSSIHCLAVFDGANVVVSGSADASLKIWRVNLLGVELTFELVQAVQINPRLFPLALALHSLDAARGLVLAVAGTKGIVQVYIALADGFFNYQCSLTGHEGWIRSLAISRETESPESDLLLASASQDKYIRLWRISRCGQESKDDVKDLIRPLGKTLSNKAHKIMFVDVSYDITFEALLLGHEDWIYNVAWRLDGNRLRLLSASADSSLAIWQLEEGSGVWVPTTRLGEISAQKGSTTATGSTGSYWIGLWSFSGDTLVSLGKTGSWRLWNYDRKRSRWVQGTGISGHTKHVADIAWSKNGAFFLSTGSDQTTRMHAAWERDTKRSWHEMARPQIHGYDLNCIDTIDHTQFISGADEKLLRVFDEPRATANLLDRLCGVEINGAVELPEVANIPVLGLSNKAVEEDDKPSEEGIGANNIESITSPAAQIPTHDIEYPPLEDHLARHTLWPEEEKLYGHGYEISAVAASHDSKLVATSCKASSLDHAVIRLYATSDWREIKPSLKAHSLTVTALRFSGDDQYLLSVGRDRQWAVFERDKDRPENYLLRHSNPKGHSRMILNCSWASTDAGRIFATAGRDKTVRIWTLQDEKFECSATIALGSAATAVDVAQQVVRGALVIASGAETGEVYFHILRLSDWTLRQTFMLADL